MIATCRRLNSSFSLQYTAVYSCLFLRQFETHQPKVPLHCPDLRNFQTRPVQAPRRCPRHEAHLVRLFLCHHHPFHPAVAAGSAEMRCATSLSEPLAPALVITRAEAIGLDISKTTAFLLALGS